MVQQDYSINEDTTLSNAQQLAAADSEWNWEGRTLIGLTKEDGTVIDPGGTTAFDAERTSVSGLWQLDKSTNPIKIYAIGSSGQISVDIIERNTSKPLADVSHPYVRKQNFVLNPGEDISADIFYENNGEGSTLSIVVTPSDGTTIKKFKAIHNVVSAQEGMNFISGFSWDYPGGYAAEWTVNNKMSIGYPFDLWSGISVDFVQGGVLTYVPNKDALNPNHPGLDD